MADENDSSSGFKVVDKRSFAADGSPRSDVPREELRREPPPFRPESAEETPEAPEYSAEEVTGFSTLVSYLSTTALFQLGLLAGPGGERIPADLPNARRTIDLLEVLEQKTRGNLNPEESRLLEDVLYELRMSFVEIQKRAAGQRR